MDFINIFLSKKNFIDLVVCFIIHEVLLNQVESLLLLFQKFCLLNNYICCVELNSLFQRIDQHIPVNALYLRPYPVLIILFMDLFQ